MHMGLGHTKNFYYKWDIVKVSPGILGAEYMVNGIVADVIPTHGFLHQLFQVTLPLETMSFRL